jgi:hypothetical protein
VSERPDDTMRRVPSAKLDDVDLTSDASFPASDPPSWAPLHVGTPGRSADAPRDARTDETPPRRRDR